MSSPKRRIETDVMKLMMSDYEVTLVNDNMQEFYVIFKGPQESKRIPSILLYPTDLRRKSWSLTSGLSNSTICRWQMESPRRAPGRVPLQVTLDRLRQPHLPPEHR
jgi:hypothetical protein